MLYVHLALTFENVFALHAHAFNIDILLAVAPPYRRKTKPGAQWEASGMW